MNDGGDGIPGSGQFEGMIWDGERWVAADPDAVPPRSESRPSTRPMSHRASGGMAILAAVYIGLLGLTWLRGYDDLVAKGNRLAVWAVVFGISALAVALVVGIWGVLRWSNRGRSLVAKVIDPFTSLRTLVSERRRRLREEKAIHAAGGDRRNLRQTGGGTGGID